MKITDLQTFVVANPLPHFGGLYFIFVKLTTDSGVTGYGEAYSVPFHPRVVEQMIADVAERYVIGADPSQIERLWRILYSSGFTQRPDTSMMGILSGIEMACWDIIGKEAGKPVYALLGGRVHEKLRAYSYLYPIDGDQTNVYKDPELAAERAAEYVQMGFTAVKFDPVTPYSAFDPRQLSLEHLDLAERFVKLLREAVGSRADLLFGTHGQMTPSSAIRLARRLEAYGPLWLVKPCPFWRPRLFVPAPAAGCAGWSKSPSTPKPLAVCPIALAIWKPGMWTRMCGGRGLVAPWPGPRNSGRGNGVARRWRQTQTPAILSAPRPMRRWAMQLCNGTSARNFLNP